jgi:hypothetical protein
MSGQSQGVRNVAGERVNVATEETIQELLNPTTVDSVSTLTNTTETPILATGSSGQYRDLKFLLVGNESAKRVTITIRDAFNASSRVSVPLAANGGGVVPIPKFGQRVAAKAWTAQLSTTSVTVKITAQAEIRP